MTSDDARFMLRQRGYVEGQDWLVHCVKRGQAGNDVGLELALVMLAEREVKRGPGRPRLVEQAA